VEALPELARLGVRSLKIEGRLKSADYVACVVKVYRRRLDRIFENSPQGHGGHRERKEDLDRYELEMSFSRGLGDGWFSGVDNRRLVHGRFGTKRGALAGKVEAVSGAGVGVALERDKPPLKPGDGVVFDAGRPEAGEQGGRIYEVKPAGGGLSRAELRFGRGDLDLGKVNVGDWVWKTSDPALERAVRATYEGDTVRFQRGISARARGREGEALEVEFADGRLSARVASGMALVKAEGRGLSEERAREQLGRLGGTPFRLERLDWEVEGVVMLPVSELNRLRRRLVGELERRREGGVRWSITEKEEEEAAAAGCRGEARGDCEVIAVVRTLEQVEAAAGCREAGDVYCEMEDAGDFRRAVELFRGNVVGKGRSVWVAGPRISRPGEEWISRRIAECGADGFLVRNAEQLRAFAGRRTRGDFSLNVANGLSAAFWVKEKGLERVTASYDLNAAQMAALLGTAPGGWFDVTVHQRMPLFHMEHCVFCAFLSEGRDFRDCGRPCGRRRVFLRDRTGELMAVRADAGCRNTVFNSRAQSGAEFARRFAELGARHFRVEFLDEGAEETRRTLGLYAGLLRGEVSGGAVWRELRAFSQLGVTRGSL
jgi:putative protease